MHLQSEPQNDSETAAARDKLAGRLTNLLVQTARWAGAESKLEAELRQLAHIDELTRLYNRRGFIVLGDHLLKLAERTRQGVLLVFADVDGLKQINDVYGHHEGDRALIAAAEMLKKTFRSSDVVARYGGDEFTVLALEIADERPEALIARLHQNVSALRGHQLSHWVSMSVGVAHFDPHDPCPMSELLARADRGLYEQKRRPKLSRPSAAHARMGGDDPSGTGQVGEDREAEWKFPRPAGTPREAH